MKQDRIDITDTEIVISFSFFLIISSTILQNIKSTLSK